VAQKTSIEWCRNPDSSQGTSWNPVVGCSKVSAGCAHCYAERMANRLAAVARAKMGRGEDPGRLARYMTAVNENGKWNARVEVDYGAMEDPLHWRRPRFVFVCSMSDLFHERLHSTDHRYPYRPGEFKEKGYSVLLGIWNVMRRCPQHTFQILTKRPDIMADLVWRVTRKMNMEKPLPNVWLGTTVEKADNKWRFDALRRSHAVVRFLSLEPLLGPLPRLPLHGIDQVIVGGEFGPGARPMKPEWVRQIRDRCITRSVPFFFKQWGGVNKKRNGRELDGQIWDQMPEIKA